MANCCLEVRVRRFKPKSSHSVRVFRIARSPRVSLPVGKRTRSPLCPSEIEFKAESVSEQISPLPILHKTMDCLLNLLHQPYGDSFLGLYNFLCDKMRAVWVDRRMQHEFNLQLITMLEQMIRLQIIAMHEVCEHTKGAERILSIEQNRLVALWSRFSERHDMKRPQPVLCSIKTREVVMSYLNTSLETLDQKGVHPNQCILAFNDALDKAFEDIDTAASANPCPELATFHDKLRLLVLRWCKLPTFLDDLSFLNQGSVYAEELEEQKLRLEDCIISYLNQTSRIMNHTWATKQASVMLQKSVSFELHSTSCYVVPNWVLIFRRVFDWRLNVLAD